MQKVLEKAARSSVRDIQAHLSGLGVVIWIERRNAKDLRALAATDDLALFDAIDIREVPTEVLAATSPTMVDLPKPKRGSVANKSTFFTRLRAQKWGVGVFKRIELADRVLVAGVFTAEASDFTVAHGGSLADAVLAHIDLRLSFEARLAQDKEILDRISRNLMKINTAEVAGDQLHDIKDQLLFMETPLIELEDVRELSPQRRRSLLALRSLHSRASSLASGFLEQARDNRIQLAREGVDSLLSGTISHFRLVAERNATSLSVVRPRNDVIVMVDKYRITKAFHNVLSNAVHFAGKQNSAGVQSRGRGHVDIIVEPMSSGFCSVAIRDNGPGFADITRAGEVGYTTRQGGTGMGLAIAKAVLEAHHGRLEISSSRGGGARVSLLLPLA